MNIRKPSTDDINGLINLSRKYTKEHDWVKHIPIGQITNVSVAEDRLFGENVYQVLVAEENENLIGYIGIYKYDTCYGASILIDREYRGEGLGKRLTDELFKLIPEEIEVEAWVASFNKLSLKATPRMGFKLKERFLEKEFIPGREFYLHIFSRNGDKKMG